ncbi:MAG TPA: ABC transporter ATP-binding protein [Spirochaetes bacterium]|nr:ABC transporter ATP-binding protein [Spirochaetota bacterium]
MYRNINKLNLSELQRVALARTLSTKPSLMLLDEPLSNLDAALREKTRVELKHFHDRWGITMIYVTHDQIEAISLANRVAIMKQGKLQQYDTARTIYREPANVFVAQFIGIRPEHITVSKTKKSETALTAEVYAVEPLGLETILDLEIDDTIIRALVETEYSAEVGERMYFGAAVDKMNLFDAETERNLKVKG